MVIALFCAGNRGVSVLIAVALGKKSVRVKWEPLHQRRRVRGSTLSSFSSTHLAVTLALCLNSHKVSFLICQMIIKSASYPEGFLNEVLRDVYKNTSGVVNFFDKTNIKCIEQSMCLKFSSQKIFFFQRRNVSLSCSCFAYLCPSGYFWGDLLRMAFAAMPSVRGFLVRMLGSVTATSQGYCEDETKQFL